jgi:hypothetical protein
MDVEDGAQILRLSWVSGWNKAAKKEIVLGHEVLETSASNSFGSRI